MTDDLRAVCIFIIAGQSDLIDTIGWPFFELAGTYTNAGHLTPDVQR